MNAVYKLNRQEYDTLIKIATEDSYLRKSLVEQFWVETSVRKTGDYESWMIPVYVIVDYTILEKEIPKLSKKYCNVLNAIKKNGLPDLYVYIKRLNPAIFIPATIHSRNIVDLDSIKSIEGRVFLENILMND